MDMTPDRWSFTCHYLQEVFGGDDRQLATLMPRAIAAGIPDIAVSADVGRLLKLLTSMTNDGRGANLIVEVGTLAGYSGIWLARGLQSSPFAKLITIDIDPKHQAFARAEFAAAGLKDRVDLRLGAALDVLPSLAKELGPNSIDVAFIDGVKAEYPEYFRLLKPLIKPRGLFLADNILGSSWWIDQLHDPLRNTVDGFNRTVASDPDFETAGLPIRQGILVARKLR